MLICYFGVFWFTVGFVCLWLFVVVIIVCDLLPGVVGSLLIALRIGSIVVVCVCLVVWWLMLPWFVVVIALRLLICVWCVSCLLT